ncbi:MAG: iron ABC transporter permease [Spirochaetaceae bacterium]|jgi:iron complex transport system permease protein|nr:iron ABC transporter permease [Spirochaetaceae bacterium]
MHGIAAAGRRWLRTGPGFTFLLIAAVFTLMLSVMLSVSAGVAGGGIGTLFKMREFSGRNSMMGRIMFEMRLPRALAACMTGAAFALAGSVMQGITHNPLADSGLLGINAGAGFMVILTTVLRPSMSAIGTMFSAFLGGALAAALVYGLGMGKKTVKTIRLILAGSAVAAMLSALSQGLALGFGLSRDLSFWSSGSLSGISWARLRIASPLIIAALITGLVISGKLSVLALGEEIAAGLGLNIWAVRLMGLAVVLALAGLSVTLAGGISFLGLIVPHTARFLAGSDYRRIMPVSALLGGILLVLSDAAARMINAPFDTPVGALVSLIGVPFFLAMTFRKKGGNP